MTHYRRRDLRYYLTVVVSEFAAFLYDSQRSMEDNTKQVKLKFRLTGKGLFG